MSSSKSSRRDFIKIGAAAVGGAAVASAVEVPLLTSQVQEKDNELKLKDEQLQQKDQQIGQLQGQVNDASRMTGFLTLNPGEQAVVEAIAETMIPADETGPGAKESGVIYFIDRQLAGNYGRSAGMYLKGPFLQPGQDGSVTVDDVEYPDGTPSVGLIRGGAYQYPFNLREYWRRGLEYLQGYTMSAYGANFEDLSMDNRTKVLQDLWDNKPTNFEGPRPIEFFFELHDLVIGGFFADPLYGGNAGLVAWKLVGSNGTNEGIGGSYSLQQLMVMKEPVKLNPMSLSDIQGGGK